MHGTKMGLFTVGPRSQWRTNKNQIVFVEEQDEKANKKIVSPLMIGGFAEKADLLYVRELACSKRGWGSATTPLVPSELLQSSQYIPQVNEPCPD